MSRTDKTRPYRVRVADPDEKLRFWYPAIRRYPAQEPIQGEWHLGGRKAIFGSPPREYRRSFTRSERNKKMVWAKKARYDHEIEPPEGRHRHSAEWNWA
jgi:hypothetical protein